MRSVKGLGLLIVIGIALVGCCPGNDLPEKVPISGFVYDSAGRPVANCSVSSTNRSEENAIITDASGKFLTSVFPGWQTISVSCLATNTRPEENMNGTYNVDVPPSGEHDIKITVK